jgi:hypothetical protein
MLCTRRRRGDDAAGRGAVWRRLGTIAIVGQVRPTGHCWASAPDRPRRVRARADGSRSADGNGVTGRHRHCWAIAPNRPRRPTLCRCRETNDCGRHGEGSGHGRSRHRRDAGRGAAIVTTIPRFRPFSGLSRSKVSHFRSNQPVLSPYRLNVPPFSLLSGRASTRSRPFLDEPYQSLPFQEQTTRLVVTRSLVVGLWMPSTRRPVANYNPPQLLPPVAKHSSPVTTDRGYLMPRPPSHGPRMTSTQRPVATNNPPQLPYKPNSATPLSRPWPCHHHAMVSPPQSCRRVVSATLVSRIGHAVVSARTRPRLVSAMSTPRPSLFP